MLAIATHRLVVLAEVNTVSQNWGNLLSILSLAEALEEVATRVAEEAWLDNEYAFNISFDYIHCFCFNFCSLIRSSKIIPSFFVDKASCTRQFESEFSLHSLASLFPIKKGFFLPLRLSCKERLFSKTYPSFLTVKEGFFLPLRLSCKESSTFTPSPSSSGSGDVTALLGARNRYALRLADHQRSSPCCAGWDRLGHKQ